MVRRRRSLGPKASIPWSEGIDPLVRRHRSLSPKASIRGEGLRDLNELRTCRSPFTRPFATRDGPPLPAAEKLQRGEGQQGWLPREIRCLLPGEGSSSRASRLRTFFSNSSLFRPRPSDRVPAGARRRTGCPRFRHRRAGCRWRARRCRFVAPALPRPRPASFRRAPR